VTTVNEAKLLGTAGTLLANSSFCDNEDVMLIHADNYCQANFEEFQEAHLRRPKECLMTMMTFRSPDPSSCGIVEVDKNGVLKNFIEKPSNPSSNLANGAIYILSGPLIAYIENNFPKAMDFSLDILPNLMGKIFCYETNEQFIDIGTLERYEIASKN
jgi:mannose-1-phosphate guanylyltransferase